MMNSAFDLLCNTQNKMKVMVTQDTDSDNADDEIVVHFSIMKPVLCIYRKLKYTT